VALEFLAIVEDEKLLDNVNKVGAYLQSELKTIVEKSAAAKEVRGRGFIQGINLEIPARRLWMRLWRRACCLIRLRILW